MQKQEFGSGFYCILIFASLALAAGRIAVVSSPEGDTAFLSANDRSRWCTVSSLIDDGTYKIDRQISIVDPKHRHRFPWQTIDKVQHIDREGDLHFYSSKPPLFPTMVAGVYAVVKSVSGLSIMDQPIYVPRIILAVVNLPLLFVFLWSTIGVIDRVCQESWSKQVGAVATCFGTMVLPFSISLNNHLPAATAMAVAMAIYFQMKEHSNRWWFLVAGVAAGFAAANELPALSMAVFLGGLFLWLDRRATFFFVFGFGLVAIAFFGTNWIAHQSLRPPYAHRGDGAQVFSWPKNEEFELQDPAESTAAVSKIREVLRDEFGLTINDPVELTKSDDPGRFRVFSPVGHFSLVESENQFRLGRWDDWYEYPGSYWQDGNRRGVDSGRTFASDLLVSHDGGASWDLFAHAVLVAFSSWHGDASKAIGRQVL